MESNDLKPCPNREHLPLLQEAKRNSMPACRILELLSERWLFEHDPTLVTRLRESLVSHDDFQAYLDAQPEFRALCAERGVPRESKPQVLAEAAEAEASNA